MYMQRREKCGKNEIKRAKEGLKVKVKTRRERMRETRFLCVSHLLRRGCMVHLMDSKARPENKRRDEDCAMQ